MTAEGQFTAAPVSRQWQCSVRMEWRSTATAQPLTSKHNFAEYLLPCAGDSGRSASTWFE